MELIRKYEGAVFFVDILGISALTQNAIKLSDKDYEPWLAEHGITYSNQYLAAAILAEFRDILINLNKEFHSTTITQLSDCAFAWSEDISEIVLFASKFMNTAIQRGLLCRGGMSYGEIIETNQPHDLGRFIVGKAVTEAATLEKAPKGARILIHSDFPHQLWSQNPSFSEIASPLFAPFTNPLDYMVYDEFRWYLCPNLTPDMTEIHFLSFDERVKITKDRLKQAAHVRCSPRFNWNAISPQGKIHLIATVNFMAQNRQIGVLHNFEWESLIENRSQPTVERVIKSVETYPDYRIWKDPEPEDWAE